MAEPQKESSLDANDAESTKTTQLGIALLAKGYQSLSKRVLWAHHNLSCESEDDFVVSTPVTPTFFSQYQWSNLSLDLALGPLDGVNLRDFAEFPSTGKAAHALSLHLGIPGIAVYDKASDIKLDAYESLGKTLPVLHAILPVEVAFERTFSNVNTNAAAYMYPSHKCCDTQCLDRYADRKMPLTYTYGLNKVDEAELKTRTLGGLSKKRAMDDAIAIVDSTLDAEPAGQRLAKLSVDSGHHMREAPADYIGKRSLGITNLVGRTPYQQFKIMDAMAFSAPIVIGLIETENLLDMVDLLGMKGDFEHEYCEKVILNNRWKKYGEQAHFSMRAPKWLSAKKGSRAENIYAHQGRMRCHSKERSFSLLPLYGYEELVEGNSSCSTYTRCGEVVTEVTVFIAYRGKKPDGKTLQEYLQSLADNDDDDWDYCGTTDIDNMDKDILGLMDARVINGHAGILYKIVCGERHEIVDFLKKSPEQRYNKLIPKSGSVAEYLLA